MRSFESIIEDLKKIVTKDRMKTHGDPVEQFAMTAKFWGTYLGVNVSSVDVAALMELSKISRSRFGEFNYDDWRDNLGYALIGARLASANEPIPGPTGGETYVCIGCGRQIVYWLAPPPKCPECGYNRFNILYATGEVSDIV